MSVDDYCAWKVGDFIPPLKRESPYCNSCTGHLMEGKCDYYISVKAVRDEMVKRDLQTKGVIR